MNGSRMSIAVIPLVRSAEGTVTRSLRVSRLGTCADGHTLAGPASTDVAQERSARHARRGALERKAGGVVGTHLHDTECTSTARCAYYRQAWLIDGASC